MNKVGHKMHEFATELWPINRSITGEGVRKTLAIVKRELPNLCVFEVPSGTKVFDWVIPPEWSINEAWIKDSKQGVKLCDFSKNNLHVVGYSTSIHEKMPLHQLQKHLYSLPDQPDAIPYVTSYYRDNWGFCLSQKERNSLEDGEYEVFIDSRHFNGALTYGEAIFKGDSEEEIFLSTYICHPSMANNELSGPTVATYIGKWLSQQKSRRYTYRIIFIPETIGSITYLSRNLKHLKKFVVGGFNLSCIGDNRAYSYLPSRQGDTISDQIAQHVMRHLDENYNRYSWKDRGSDERQYCAPHVDLPIATISRSKYAEYDEYHTSLDNLIEVVTPEGLEGGYNAVKRALQIFEKNVYPSSVVYGEPQLGRRGLYPTTSTKTSGLGVRNMMNVLSYFDGKISVLEIAEKCSLPFWKTIEFIDLFVQHNLVKVSNSNVTKNKPPHQ